MVQTIYPNNSSMRNVKGLSIKDINILILLAKENTLKCLSEALESPKSTMSERLSVFRKIRLIRARGNTINKTFELLPLGKEAINRFLEGGCVLPIKLYRIHNLSYTLRHNRPNSLMDRIAKKGCFMAYTRNQYKEFKNYRGNLLDCTIEFKPNVVIITLPEIWSFSVEEGHSEAMRKVMEIKAELEMEFDGLQLGDVNRIATLNSQHNALIADHFSVELMKFNENRPINAVYRGVNLDIDTSTGLPETETTNKITAVEDMERLCRMAEFIAVGSITPNQILEVSKYLQASGLGYLAPTGSALRI